MLWDENFIQELPDIEGKWKAPFIAYVVKEATVKHKNVKNLILKWYNKIPDEKKPKYAPRLRSKNNREFISQIMEFYVAEFLEQYGCVEFDPILETGQTPELLLTINGKQALVDVVTLFGPQEDIENLICNLEKFVSNFDYTLDYEFIDLGILRESCIRKELELYFSGLDPNNINEDECCLIEKEGFKGVFTPVWKGVSSEKTPTTCQALCGPAIKIEPLAAIWNRIKEKLSKYSHSWDGPIMVAICKDATFGTDWDDVASVLYGEITTQYNPRSHEVMEKWCRNGLVRPNQNRSLSGVIHCSLDWSHDNPALNGLFLQNPYAKYPFSIELPTYPTISDGSFTFTWSKNNGKFLGHH